MTAPAPPQLDLQVKPTIDFKKNPRCGGRDVHGDPDAGCGEGAAPLYKWICNCAGKPVKLNYEILYQVVQEIYADKCYKGKKKYEGMKALCLRLSVYHSTFKKYEVMNYENVRKQFLKWLADAKKNNGFDNDYNFKKYETPFDRLLLKIAHCLKV